MFTAFGFSHPYFLEQYSVPGLTLLLLDPYHLVKSIFSESPRSLYVEGLSKSP